MANDNKMKRPPMKKGIIGRILKMLLKEYKLQMNKLILQLMLMELYFSSN